MELRKLLKLFVKAFSLSFLCLIFLAAKVHAEEENTTYQIQLESSAEFSITNQDSASFVLRPLKDSLRSIDTLKNTEAVGILYLGQVTLADSATPLSALRDAATQISKQLDKELTLITDSTTSESLQPHAMLLLYHPEVVITLALTHIAGSESYSIIGTYALTKVSGDLPTEISAQENSE